MPGPEGFWSYVHKDDQADGGRIIQLARDLAAQYEVITGYAINLFLDRDSIDWGDNWRGSIDQGLARTAFFIAVLTPRYFMSSECRRELQAFAGGAERLGVRDLILPVLYVDIPGFGDEANGDEAQRLIRDFQWVDWRQLRFAGRDSVAYRTAVAELAKRLVEANSKVAGRNSEAAGRFAEASQAAAAGFGSSASADELDFDDLEEMLDRKAGGAGSTAMEIAAEMQNFQDALEAPDASSATIERVASSIAGPASRFLGLANKFSAQVYDLDVTACAYISRALDEINRDASRKPRVCVLFAGRTGAAKTFRATIDDFREVAEILDDDTAPRQYWPAVQKMKFGLAIIIESCSVMDEWAEAIRSSKVDCASG